MWVFTRSGFISVVENRDDQNTVLVRSRVRETLRGVPGSQILHTPENDYPYRVVSDKQAFANWLAEQAKNVDYGNFKAACSDCSVEYQDALHNVWWELADKFEHCRHPTPAK